MKQRWVPVRKREDYRKMVTELNNAIDEYWLTQANQQTLWLWVQQTDACEQITLMAYKLLTFLRREHAGLNPCIDDAIIGGLQDIIVDFYGLTDDSKTSYQKESDILEALSRSAYREMKALKKAKEEMDEEEADIWR